MIYNPNNPRRIHFREMQAAAEARERKWRTLLYARQAREVEND